MNRLTILTVGLVILGQAAMAQPASGDKKASPKVVFVCEHGSAKSVMAAAEFERLAKQKGLAFQVLSRGANPDAEIDAPIRQHLLADGMNIGPAKPAKVSEKDLQGATRVISFGPELAPLLPNGMKALDWSAMPSPNKDYRVAREYLLKQLDALVLEMQKSEHAK